MAAGYGNLGTTYRLAFMNLSLPGATRIELAALSSIVLLPALAGFAVATALYWTLPDAAGGVGWMAFALGVVKLCYLGTAAAHLGRWIADRTDGGPNAPGWWESWDDWDETAHRRQKDAAADWTLFPNPLDACLLAIALTTLAHRLA